MDSRGEPPADSLATSSPDACRRPRRLGTIAVVEHETGDVRSKLPARIVVEAGVLSGEDAAQPGLSSRSLEARKAPVYAGQAIGRHDQVLVVWVEGSQDGGGCLTHGGVGARIGRVWSSDRQGSPVGITGDAWIARAIAQANGRYRPPHV